jgi:hypothetical protein
MGDGRKKTRGIELPTMGDRPGAPCYMDILDKEKKKKRPLVDPHDCSGEARPRLVLGPPTFAFGLHPELDAPVDVNVVLAQLPGYDARAAKVEPAQIHARTKISHCDAMRQPTNDAPVLKRPIIIRQLVPVFHGQELEHPPQLLH